MKKIFNIILTIFVTFNVLLLPSCFLNEENKDVYIDGAPGYYKYREFYSENSFADQEIYYEDDGKRFIDYFYEFIPDYDIYHKKGNTKIDILNPVEYQVLSEVNDIPVYSVDASGEKYYDDVHYNDTCSYVKLIYPSSIKRLKYSYSTIEELTVPEGVKEIRFSNCPNLKSVTLPKSLKKIRKYAFSGSAINSITIKGENVEIGEGAFYECQNLTNVIVNGSIKTINKEAFYNCDSLNNISNIIKNVEEIGEGAFKECDGIEALDLSTNKIIGKEAFEYCKNLTDIHLSNILEIGSHSFAYCDSIKKINISNSTKKIGMYSFYKCKSLEDVTIEGIPDVVEKKIFGFCYNLKKLSLGNVGYKLNNKTTGAILGDFFADSTELGINDEYIDKMDSLILVSPYNGYSTSANYYVPLYLKEIEITGDTDILRNSLASLYMIESVKITGNTKIIEKYSIAGCTNLNYLYLSKTIEEIQSDALRGCMSLNEINYEGTIEEWNHIKIHKNAFAESNIIKIICSNGTIYLEK